MKKLADQLGALFYKQWRLVLRQKLSLSFNIITPILTILFVYIGTILLKNQSTPTINGRTVDPNTVVIPKYLYPGFSDHKGSPVNFFYGAMFSQRYFDYVLLGEEKTKQGGDHFWLKMIASFVDLYDYRENLGQRFPLFRDLSSNVTSSDQFMHRLIGQLKECQTVPGGANFDPHLPDAGLLLSNVSNFQEKGIKALVLINNLASSGLKRNNGLGILRVVTNVQERLKNSSIEKRGFSYKVPTEFYSGMLNYLNNKYLLARQGYRQGLPRTQIFISPFLDFSVSDSELDMKVSKICIMIIPLAFSMGLTLVVSSLMVEKEFKILTILRINGLKMSGYWMSIYGFFLIFLNLSSTAFMALGWLTLPKVTLFDTVPKGTMLLFLCSWNFAQISMGIFATLLNLNPGATNTLSYIICFLGTAAFAVFFEKIFPYPSQVPLLFHIFPQASYTRFIYLIIYLCYSGDGPKGLWDLQGELKTCFYALPLSGLFYLLLSLMLTSTSFRRALSRAQKVYLLFRGKKTLTQGQEREFGQQGTMLADPLLTPSVSNNSQKSPDPEHSAAGSAQRDLEDRPSLEYVIEAEDLCKTYLNGKEALTNFNLKIKKNTVYGLLGHNGAGKTTFLSILTGALDKTSGRVLLGGEEVQYGASQDTSIGYCSQFDILYPVLTTLEHFKFFMRLKGCWKIPKITKIFKRKKNDQTETEERGEEGEDTEALEEPQELENMKLVDRLLDKLDLTEHKDKPIKNLSGGMQRRVSLGIAMIGNPEVILLDEPSSGLDPVRRREFWDLLKSVANDNDMAMIITTHIMEEADVLCSKIGVMKDGQIIAEGSSDELKKSYSKGMKLEIVLKRIEYLDKVKDFLHKYYKKVRIEWIFNKTIKFRLFPKTEFSVKATNVLHQNNYSSLLESAQKLVEMKLIEDWSFSRGTLEDVFLTLTSADSKPFSQV